MLWACLLLPSLSLDVFTRAVAPGSHERPLVVASGGHYPRVVATDASARAAGIRPDQLISAALALAPDVALRDRDVALEQEALAEVATLALAFTPGVSIAPPNAILAEIEGSVRLFGGLPRLLGQLSGEARSRGYDAALALAPTPTAALLLARAGHATPVLDRMQLPAALAPLSLDRLDLDADTLATLQAAGITTFGAARALPRAGLAQRFDRRFVDTLDRALGDAPDPRELYRPPPRFERGLPLPAPADSVEALVFGVDRLVSDLAGWLLARGLGVTRMSLALVHERHMGTPPTVATFALGAPARAPAHLHAVLRERLARVALPAPVEAIVLASDETSPLAGRNLGLLPEDEAGAVVVPLIERLRSRLGDAAVAIPAARADHRPRICGGRSATRSRAASATQARQCAGQRGTARARRGAAPDLAARRGAAAARGARDATVDPARWPRAHRVGLVGRPRSAPRLFRRGESARGARLDLPRPSLRRRRRRVVPARPLRVSVEERARACYCAICRNP